MASESNLVAAYVFREGIQTQHSDAAIRAALERQSLEGKDVSMTCTKCFREIDPGELWHRTAKGPQHVDCLDRSEGAYLLRGTHYGKLPEHNVLKRVDMGGESIALFWRERDAREYMQMKAEKRGKRKD